MSRMITTGGGNHPALFLLPKKLKEVAREQRGWSQNELARNIGVSPGQLSNELNGHKGAGLKLLGGLLRAFPQESVASLTVSERRVIHS